MNKSKFLKKSLAAVLAVLMIVAMIPLSAAAAYEPREVKPVVGTGFSGEVTGSGYNWNIAFNYSSTNTPKVAIETGHDDDKINCIMLNGSEQQLAEGADFTLERDADNGDAPVPFRFYVTNSTVANGEKSEIYTVNWTMGAPAGSASVKSAKLGTTDYEAKIDETAKTITFTVPFGFPVTNAVTVEFNGCTSATSTQTTATFDAAKIGTNKKKAVPIKVSAVTEDALTDISYDVYVVEEEALKSIKLGDYVGEFELATTATNGQDKDMENGTVNFYVPADFGPVSGKVELVPTFEVGSHYSNATVKNTTITSAAKITSGEKFDFKDISPVTFTLTSVTGQTKDYTLKFVPNDKDTTLTGVTVSKGTGATGATYTVEGTIEGENINVVVPKEADLTKVKLIFAGPKTISGTPAKEPTVKVPVATGTADKFSTAGKTDGTNTSAVNCTDPVKVLVTAADGKTQKYYTLTVTKADATELQPTITAAKLVLNKGKDNEHTSNGVVDTAARTITFTVPHSTLDTAVQPSTTDPIVEYTFAKSQSSFINTTALSSATISGGSKVSVSAGGGDELVYAVKYVRANPETGKSITNFVLTEAGNKNLMNYNAYKNYKVEVSGKDFKVNVPSSVTPLNASFELSKGAKLFAVPANAGNAMGAAIEPADEHGVLQATNFTFAKGSKYIVADEALATRIANSATDTTVASYTQIRNNYPNNFVEYTFVNDPATASTAARFTGNLSAVDGNITGTIGGANGNEITLTVPYSYRNGKEFFLNFTTSPNAIAGVLPATVTANAAGIYRMYSDGKKTYADDKVKAEAAAYSGGNAATANVQFKVKETVGTPNTYSLQFGAGTTWYDLTAGDTTNDNRLAVLAEDGTTNKTYFIKEVKIADANTGAEITAAKVNGVTASINQTAETITASVPFGTNLGQIKLELTASKMASVKINNAAFDADKTYDLRKPAKVAVQSEKGDKTTVYTLTVKTGEQFSDVPANAWFAPYVKEAFEKNIVQGIGEGLFGPYTHITREDFAVMTGRMLGITVDQDATVPFKDASSVSGYAKGYVAYFAEEGIIGGYEDSTFKPKNNITREEAAKILAVALDLEVTGTPTFADTNKISGWARPYVAAVQTAKVFNGDEANRFNGTTRITRAETAKVMVDSLKIK